MLVYPSIFVISTLFAYLYSVSGEKGIGRYYKILSFLVLFVPAAIRHQVGVDYSSYESIFLYASKGIPVLIEPGYWFINYAVSKVGGSYQVVVALLSFATLFFVFSSFPQRYFHHCVAVFFLVFYSWTYTSLRQMLVAAFAYYSYIHFFLNKRYVMTYVLLATSTIFHLSGFIYLPVFFALRYFYLNRLTAFYLFFSILLLIPFGQFLIDSVFSIVLAQTKYGIYFSTDSPSTRTPETSTGLGRILRFILYFLFFLPLGIIKDKKQASNGIFLLLIVVLFDILAQHMGVFSRISRGLLFGYFVMIVGIASGKSRYRIVLLSFIYVGLSLLFLGGMLNGVNLPYKTIFD